MSLAMKCDRCKNYYDVYEPKNFGLMMDANGFILKKYFQNQELAYSSNFKKAFALCPSCAKSFENWIKENDK